MYHEKRDCGTLIPWRNINNLKFIDESALIARSKKRLKAFHVTVNKRVQNPVCCFLLIKINANRQNQPKENW